MRKEIYPVFEKTSEEKTTQKPWSCGESVNLHMKGVLPKEFCINKED